MSDSLKIKIHGRERELFGETIRARSNIIEFNGYNFKPARSYSIHNNPFEQLSVPKKVLDILNEERRLKYTGASEEKISAGFTRKFHMFEIVDKGQGDYLILQKNKRDKVVYKKIETGE